MASVTNLHPDTAPEGGGLYLGPVPEDRRRMALALLLVGRPREQDAAVDHFERFADEQGLDLSTLWVATDGGPRGRMQGSVLLVPNHGSTAMLFVGQATGWSDTSAVVRLIRAVCDGPGREGVSVIQSLIDPGQVIEGQVLERAGLTRLAKLIYMQKAIEPGEHRVPRPTKLGGCDHPTLLTYSEATHTDFARAIEASYIDTLDCPGLVGMRQTDQIIEGHKSTGRFDPRNWLAYHDEAGEPIAVLLLAEVAQGSGLELVYLGVTKAYRGKKIGGQLMRYAVSEAARLGGSRLYLAVDDRNDPAIADTLRESLGQQKFAMWFDGSAQLAYDHDAKTLRVTVPNQFTRSWIERHFAADLRYAAKAAVGQSVSLELCVQQDSEGNKAVPALEAARVDRPQPYTQPANAVSGAGPALRAEPMRRTGSSFKHQLAQFVTGPSNQLAYAAAQRAADLADPTASHPLFLHGSCGVGKTHLLQGICAQARQTHPEAKVVYMTAEQFTNDFIAAVRANKLEAFRRKIRRLDLLAIDDVHFFASKEKTQIEFLCCFEENDLAGARVVLASDTHPKRISNFSEALISRCVRGLVVELKDPDTDTRRAVLTELARRRNLLMQPAVLDLLSQRYEGSVREIEGVLAQLHALASLPQRGKPAQPGRPLVVGRELVEQLPDFAAPVIRKPIRFNTIVKTVCSRLGVEANQLAGSSRHKFLVLARSLSVYLAREMTTMSYPEIAHAMGRKNHSTVITADQRLRRQIAADEPIMLPAGQGIITPAELASSLSREPSEITIESGRIAAIKPTERTCTTFVLPGFIDAHVHIESSMLTPGYFAQAAVVHGTVATVSDPHEIANVLGVPGVRFMLDNAEGIPFKFAFGAPSCVPATAFETAGAALGVDDVVSLLDDSRIYYLSEVMDFPGVLADDPKLLAMISAAKERGKPVDGHAPGLRGEQAQQYCDAGIMTDHECFTLEEAEDKLSAGMLIQIREGSAAKNFEALWPLIDRYPGRVMLCSDDKHPDELIQGHIDALVRQALAKGCDLYNVLTAACRVPVQHYGLPVGQLRVGDPADLIEVNSLAAFRVLRTFIDGDCVMEQGRSKINVQPAVPMNQFACSQKSAQDFEVPDRPGAELRVIGAIDGQLITNELRMEPTRSAGCAVSDPSRDLLKLVAVNRYEEDAEPAVAFVHGFGLKRGAIAGSVGHDSHNILAVGANDQDLADAVNAVIDLKGGLAVVDDGLVKPLPLEVGGLMSVRPCAEVAKDYEALCEMTHGLGTTLASAFMTLSFMGLLVIPELKLSDRGLFDFKCFDVVDIWA
eukprot:g12920.t1